MWCPLHLDVAALFGRLRRSGNAKWLAK